MPSSGPCVQYITGHDPAGFQQTHDTLRECRKEHDQDTKPTFMNLAVWVDGAIFAFVGALGGTRLRRGGTSALLAIHNKVLGCEINGFREQFNSRLEYLLELGGLRVTS